MKGSSYSTSLLREEYAHPNKRSSISPVALADSVYSLSPSGDEERISLRTICQFPQPGTSNLVPPYPCESFGPSDESSASDGIQERTRHGQCSAIGSSASDRVSA